MRNILDPLRSESVHIKAQYTPPTRRDETVLSRRVGVGGVYMISRRLPTDSAMRTHNAAVGRDPVYNTVANGIEVRTVATNLLICPRNSQTKQIPYE